MDAHRFDPAKLGARSRKAYDAARTINVEHWTPWPDVVARMLDASDIGAKSCSDIIRGMEWTGEMMRRGKYASGRDRRELMLIDIDVFDEATIREMCEGDEAEIALFKTELAASAALREKAAQAARRRFRSPR